MAITNERAEILAQYLTADEKRAEVLLELTAEEAAAKINADGHDFTPEELAAFAEEMEKLVAQQTGELGESELDSVAGGFIAPRIGTWAWILWKTRKRWPLIVY